MSRPRLPLLLVLIAALLPGSSPAEVPVASQFPTCGEEGGTCPPDFDHDGEWYLSSQFPSDSAIDSIAPEELPLGAGNWVDRAWQLSTGRPDPGGEVLYPEHIYRTLMADVGVEEDVADLRVEPLGALLKG